MHAREFDHELRVHTRARAMSIHACAAATPLSMPAYACCARRRLLMRLEFEHRARDLALFSIRTRWECFEYTCCLCLEQCSSPR